MDNLTTWLDEAFLTRPWCFLSWMAVAMALGTILRVCLGEAANRFGIIPRQADGLPGILWAPFFHANFSHFAANLPPFLVMGFLVLRRGDLHFLQVVAGTALLGGLLVWLLARKAAHMGMSGVIFGLLGYLVMIAWFTRTANDLLIAGGVLLVYGSMLGGIAPARNGTSWESHLFGLLAGGGMAWWLL